MKHAVLDTLNEEKVPLEKIAQMSKEMFPNGCNKILLVNIPQVGETNFDLATAKLKRYPCFPPYGLGLLSYGLRIAGYTPTLIDLNFEILSHMNDLSFRYDRWQNALRQAMESFVPDLVGFTGWSKLHVFSKPRIDESGCGLCQNELSANSNHRRGCPSVKQYTNGLGNDPEY